MATRPMAHKFEAFWKQTDKITKWLQILALVVAGVWAIRNFSVVDKPSLELSPLVSTGLDINPAWEKNVCQVRYGVTITNTGKVPFDVDRITFEGWFTEIPKLMPTPEATFINPDDFRHGRQIAKKTISADKPHPAVYLLSIILQGRSRTKILVGSYAHKDRAPFTSLLKFMGQMVRILSLARGTPLSSTTLAFPAALQPLQALLRVAKRRENPATKTATHGKGVPRYSVLSC
jgi:hypothetical protein